MKATELRLGNWIIDSHLECKVDATTFFKCKMLNYEIDNVYKPIELTEEWLVKFGFDIETELKAWGYITKVKYIQFADDIYLIFENNKWVLGYLPSDKKDFETLNESNNIQYVHELQNLYFALTGKEL